MSMNKQVFWLRGRPTSFAFLLDKKQWLKKRSSLDTAALTTRDSHPLPYSPQAVAWGTCSRFKAHNLHYLVWPFKELHNM
jgi:hypothetical protein